MPFEGEHACRLNDPDQYDELRRDNNFSEDDGRRIDAILGITENGDEEDDVELQSFRYPVEEWDEDDARDHCTGHDAIEFEPAADSDDENNQTMTQDNEPEYRQHYRPDGEEARAVEIVEHDDDTFSIRMPIASTGEVRNEGDEPLSREEIDGMARQLSERQIPVFPAHGRDNSIAAGRYSPFEKLGYWDDGEVTERESDSDLLMASARMMDPETLPNLGPIRQALGTLKEQARRNIAIDSSIGWRDDESFPGGVDLMEASIVGIGADWRTNTGTEAAMARAAIATGADPGQFLDRVRSAVMGTDGLERPDERHLSSQQAETALQIVHSYRDEQGDGSVENFEGWLWNVAWDEFDENQFHAAHTALKEWYRDTTPLDEPVSERFLPFLEAGGDGESSTNENMTDSDAPDDEQSGTDDEETTEREEAPEWASEMLEMQREQTESLQVIADHLLETDEEEDDDDDEEEDDEEQSSESPEEEQASDTDDDEEVRVTITVDGEKREVSASEAVEEMKRAKEDGIKLEPFEIPGGGESDGDRDADESDESDESNAETGSQRDPLEKYQLRG